MGCFCAANFRWLKGLCFWYKSINLSCFCSSFLVKFVIYIHCLCVLFTIVSHLVGTYKYCRQIYYLAPKFSENLILMKVYAEVYDMIATQKGFNQGLVWCLITGLRCLITGLRWLFMVNYSVVSFGPINGQNTFTCNIGEFGL